MDPATLAKASSPWVSHLARIKHIQREVPGVATYALEFEDQEIASAFRFLPGQFNMLYLPGDGEAAISISSDPQQVGSLLHTVRVAGNVTRAIARLSVGDQIGVRGPYGSTWPVEACRGKDVVVACGGIGLAPLRPVVYHLINHREEYGKIFVLYGARTPNDLLYSAEYEAWREADIQVEVTVDLGAENWNGTIGVVPVLFYRLRLDPEVTRVMTCGPEIMMRFVIFEALARKIDPKHIFLSMERNMSCAIGLCGNCQLGPNFVCKDGPIFTYQQMEESLRFEDL